MHDPSGRRRDDCFFSLDLALSATQILEIFSRRWPLEVCFRDVKQFLGFEDPQNRVAKATTRTAPLIFFIYDLALLWYAQAGHQLATKSALGRLYFISAPDLFAKPKTLPLKLKAGILIYFIFNQWYDVSTYQEPTFLI